jgi:zeaxanthin glucosyltransferase
MSTVLLISPDYASHYFPLSAVGRSLQDRGHHAVVATGSGLAPKVIDDGFTHASLALGPGSNPGLMRPRDQSEAERAQLEEFFAVSKKGMVPTLLHQARNRMRDLLHEPHRVAVEIERIVSSYAPDVIVVDHLAFGATAALRGMRQPFVAFHPGHPSAIAEGSPYGYPPRIPPRIRVDEEGLDSLREICDGVVQRFTDEYNGAMAVVDPGADAVDNAFVAGSRLGTLINYPEALGSSYRLPGGSRFIGSAVRGVEPSTDVSRPGQGRRPRVYAALGSFFSGRSDILRNIVAAFRHEPVELVMATGVTPVSELGDLPDHWIVADNLPQPAVIASADLVITHGGNNTITESLTAGVPLLVGPLSTDQFTAAADVESAGLGMAFDPNFDGASTIAEMAECVLASGAVEAAGHLGASLRATPGQYLAADLIERAMVEVPAA